MMIIFDLLILGVTLYMYMSFEMDKVLLIIGSLSGIVVDFIGVIFIKMYNKNIEVAVKFHAKFAESNNLLLANSIANKIEINVERTLWQKSPIILFFLKIDCSSGNILVTEN